MIGTVADDRYPAGCRIETHHRGVIADRLTVWIAVGTYRGERVEVKSKSPGSASTLWRKSAEYRGG